MTDLTGLDVQNLTKTYGPKKALGGISFVAPHGGFTVLLGPGGAGKTTTLRLLAGLEPQTEGQIFLDGQEISRLAPRDRNMAMIFDNLALYPNKNGFQNLASPLVLKKTPMEEIRKRVFSLAEKLNLTLVLDRLPKTMSGGEKQRLALGRALIREPRLFLLDEPLSSVDAPLRFKLRSELKRLQKEEGHTFLMATPDFTEALAVGDTIIMLHEGRITQVASPQKLYDQPVDTRVAIFVGSPQINLFQAEFREGQLAFLGLSCPCPARLAPLLADQGRGFTVGLRPENAALVFDDTEVKPGDILGEGVLVDIESLGRTMALTLKCGQDLITTLASASVLSQITIGQARRFRIKDPNLLLAFKPDGRNFLV
ncbi:MAG: ABC transporter ATP-binding protein [Deltaproteobacteria bacterium]|jgi:multiple sugar transport system ATP-binding protein|nr:ABC transporter ATP-binding protein [Deltaproteobacteria bacterium]